MNEGPIDGVKVEWDCGWEVGVGRAGEVVVGKWIKLYLNISKKKE